MSVSLILNLLNLSNKITLWEPLASKIYFYSISSINSVSNLHKFDIPFITYQNKLTLSILNFKGLGILVRENGI
jgi:hypothetical protein